MKLFYFFILLVVAQTYATKEAAVEANGNLRAKRSLNGGGGGGGGGNECCLLITEIIADLTDCLASCPDEHKQELQNILDICIGLDACNTTPTRSQMEDICSRLTILSLSVPCVGVALNLCVQLLGIL